MKEESLTFFSVFPLVSNKNFKEFNASSHWMFIKNPPETANFPQSRIHHRVRISRQLFSIDRPKYHIKKTTYLRACEADSIFKKECSMKSFLGKVHVQKLMKMVTTNGKLLPLLNPMKDDQVPNVFSRILGCL